MTNGSVVENVTVAVSESAPVTIEQQDFIMLPVPGENICRLISANNSVSYCFFIFISYQCLMSAYGYSVKTE